MKLSEFKQSLSKLGELNFSLPDGTEIPSHFHITEAGLTTKHFVDCGGQVRTEKNITFQIWSSHDVDHRLTPEKLLKIISISGEIIGGGDHDVEVEYQTDTTGRYGLAFDGEGFLLTPKHTDCLAKDHCGVPAAAPAYEAAGCCTPSGGCC
ncbi:MAG: DUF6428 family protein [Balneolaceae bacterium]